MGRDVVSDSKVFQNSKSTRRHMKMLATDTIVCCTLMVIVLADQIGVSKAE